MPSDFASTLPLVKEIDTAGARMPEPCAEIEIGLLTGCQDRPYAFGLAMALISKGIHLDVIGSDEVDSPEMHSTPGLRFLNLRGNQRQDLHFVKKMSRLLTYYVRLMHYAVRSRTKILHILWNNKIEFFDRTLLMVFYKMLGKKIVLTAHNVNQARRDANDSLLNRLTLKTQYRLTNHIFVHTQKAKSELVKDFGIREGSATVIPFGINNAVPHTNLTPADARRHLGIKVADKAILFFGRMRPYKGLEHLLAAYQELQTRDSNYRLIIAGESMKGFDEYLNEILQIIRRIDSQERIISKIQFIPDEDTELYFKAADVLVLPYKEIFQSGVLYLAYSFGLPVVAADVGSFREEIIEGRTGFLCNSTDAMDLANTIERYFGSDLYSNLKNRRQDIQNYVNDRHSWNVVGEMTRNVYAELLVRERS